MRAAFKTVVRKIMEVAPVAAKYNLRKLEKMARRGELHTVRVTGEQSKRHRGRPRKKSLRGSCTLDKAAPPSANVGKRHSRDAPDPSVCSKN